MFIFRTKKYYLIVWKLKCIIIFKVLDRNKAVKNFKYRYEKTTLFHEKQVNDLALELCNVGITNME